MRGWNPVAPWQVYFNDNFLRLAWSLVYFCCLTTVSCAADNVYPPGSYEAAYREAVKDYNAGRYVDGLVHAENAVKLATEKGEKGEEQLFHALNVQSILQQMIGNLTESASIQQRGLALAEKHFGPSHIEVAHSLVNLAIVLRDLGQLDEAEPLLIRARDILVSQFGPEHTEVAQLHFNLGLFYLAQTKYQLAEDEFLSSQRAYKALRDEGSVTEVQTNLGAVYFEMKRYEEAEKITKSVLEAKKRIFGANHPSIAIALTNLGGAQLQQGNFDDAQQTYLEALRIYRSTIGDDHRNTGDVYRGLGLVFFQNRNWEKCLEYLHKAAAIEVANEGRNKARSKSQVETEALYVFHNIVFASWNRSRTQGLSQKMQSDLRDEAFEAAQRAMSVAASQSLSKMSIRYIAPPAIAPQVRHQQDLLEKRQVLDSSLLDELGKPSSQRSDITVDALRSELARLNEELSELTSSIQTKFPRFAELTVPKPVSFKTVQSVLGANEALVFFAPQELGLFTFVVTPNQIEWLQADVGSVELGKLVDTLRCGLDRSAWVDASTYPASSVQERERRDRQIARRAHCIDLTGLSQTEKQTPPFDLAKSYDLFTKLFAQIEPLVKTSQLVVVAAQPLSQLPFQVLVTRPTDDRIPKVAADYVKADWLIKRQSVSIAPSVSSFVSLRSDAKASEAPRAYMGFGNPLLTGPRGTDQRAYAKQSCNEVRGPVKTTGYELPDPISSFFRGSSVDVVRLSRQRPLPETADELCSVANALGSKDVFLGKNATEANVKELSKSGLLVQARVVHFATHGLLATESETISDAVIEPALLLTPPTTASDDDDGLLTASEISALHMDADWVVLSACNTAAGSKRDSDSLAGLARAFFYAGSRALLVTHWNVESDAAVNIVTGSFSELKRQPSMARAEALRRSMLQEMESQRPPGWLSAAHPLVWAPFVLIGEGR